MSHPPTGRRVSWVLSQGAEPRGTVRTWPPAAREQCHPRQMGHLGTLVSSWVIERKIEVIGRAVWIQKKLVLSRMGVWMFSPDLSSPPGPGRSLAGLGEGQGCRCSFPEQIRFEQGLAGLSLWLDGYHKPGCLNWVGTSQFPRVRRVGSGLPGGALLRHLAGFLNGKWTWGHSEARAASERQRPGLWAEGE